MNAKEKGLTLIELITVLSILSVIVLITIPSMKFFDSKTSRVKLKLIANEIINDIRYIQQKKIFEDENLYFGVKADHTGYYINKAGTISARIKTKNLPEGIKIYKNTAGEISFSSIGSPNGGCTITLKNSSNQIDITLLLSTGRVMVQGDY